MSDEALLGLAAENIARTLGRPPDGAAMIVTSTTKTEIAEAIRERLRTRLGEVHLLRLDDTADAGTVPLARCLQDLAADGWGLVLLLAPVHAPFLFRAVGRPDMGLRIDATHLFCDWMIHPGSLLRTHGVDMRELHRFRTRLLAALGAGQELHITSPGGTDIHLRSRDWEATDGELFTTPVESLSTGTIVVDGCAYSGPPQAPFTLQIHHGRVTNIADLDLDDEQQRMVYHDLTRDENASVLAELGIGINPGARWDKDVMESEQARGTCHFGFGHNLPYGGQNPSSYHFDLVILRPTIHVGGRTICRQGEYVPEITED